MPTTPQSEFRPAILEALQRSQGKAWIADVYVAVQNSMGDRFTQDDRRLIPESAPAAQREPRWMNAVRQEARKMRRQGVLLPSHTIGLWELTGEH